MRILSLVPLAVLTAGLCQAQSSNPAPAQPANAASAPAPGDKTQAQPGNAAPAPAPGAPAQDQSSNPAFNPAPVAGDKTVTIDTPSAISEGTQIALFTPVATSTTCNATSTAVSLASYTNTKVMVTGGQGHTTVTLATALVQGEILCGTVGTTAISQVTVGAAPTPPGFDWGLVRAYFTFGGLLSQSDGQFSHTDLFMDFHLDKTYVQLGNLDNTGKHSFYPGLNSFFDTRLTALPVAVQPCASSSSSSTSSSSSCASSSSASSSSSSTSSSTSTPTQVFLNSQKTARLQFGVYAPFTLNRWAVATKAGAANTTKPTPYSLYIGPLVKTGFDTSVNGLNQTQQESSTPSLVQPIGTSSSFYKFYDFGFRLGHYQLSGAPPAGEKSGTAPDILSYLDVAWGRFSNMGSLLCPKNLYNGYSSCSPPAGSTTAPLLPWAHDWRLSVEGLLEVPGGKGLSIGFSSNVSQPTSSTVLNGVTYVHIRPQDDLRFLFAYRFDISTIATKLAGQSQ